MGIGAVVISVGFSVIYTLGLRKTGIEVGGEKIWWNYLRPFHAIMYGLFAFSALSGDKNAWLILLLDTIIGLVNYLLVVIH